MSRTSRRGAHRFILERDAANLVKPPSAAFLLQRAEIKRLIVQRLWHSISLKIAILNIRDKLTTEMASMVSVPSWE
jgi:hypothetical protein